MRLFDWDGLVVGERISVVLSMVCFDDGPDQRHLAFSLDRRGLKIGITGKLPNGSVLSGIDLVVTAVYPLQLAVDPLSVVFPVPVCHQREVFQVLDFCAGLGGLTVGLSTLGFKVVAAVDENKSWVPLYHSLHDQGVQYYVGDMASTEVLTKLMIDGFFHGTIAAGVNCQPHSLLGDRKGMQDERAVSLPKALYCAWMLQAAILVVECVPSVLGDPVAQDIIRRFAVATGYRVSQSIVKLGNAWVCKRDRWIAIFSAPPIGLIDLPDLPFCDDYQVVGHVMPRLMPWPESDMQQLRLNLYELSKFHEFAVGGVEALYFDVSGKCPTLLHSAGNQLYACQCGCRGPLSLQRISTKGLVGVLVPLGTTQVHCQKVMEHCRYLHPEEMWVLMGGMPGQQWGVNLRLAMAGIVQAISPIVGLWIFAHVKRQLESFLGVTSQCKPRQVLDLYLQQLSAKCSAFWIPEVPPTVPCHEADESVEDVVPAQLRLSFPSLGVPSQPVAFVRGLTGRQLLEAEAALDSERKNWTLRVDGLDFDVDLPLPDNACLQVVPVAWTDVRDPCSSPVPCCLSLNEVRSAHKGTGVPGDDPTTLQGIGCLQAVTMSMNDRQAILAQQGPVWGDDEILFGLTRIALVTDDDQFVQVWDPLLLSNLLVLPDSPEWKSLVGALTPVATVISAVLVGTHWVPVVFRVDSVGAKLFTTPVQDAFTGLFEGLCHVIGRFSNGLAGAWTSHAIPFLVTEHCGALVLCFVRHLLCGESMPVSASVLSDFARRSRLEFVQEMQDQCLRPMLAGLGVTEHEQLADMLAKHGVPGAESKDRAQHVMQVLGKEPVVKAMQSSNPWKELKWLANQSRPPMQLIKPSELRQVVEKRQADHPVGTKRHKVPKGKGKGVRLQPYRIDPDALRLEAGVFQTMAGAPLSQVSLVQLGPAVSGVAIVSKETARPYLQAAHPVSSGALALFVVDGDEYPVSQFAVTKQRVPLVCASNAEPVLLDGLLVQVGGSPVVRAPAAVKCAVQAVATCVVKVMVYKDMTVESWDQVSAHPVRHVFSKLPPLQPCEDSDCMGCESWHRSESFPLDTPVIEIWGKQWLKLNYASAAPPQADIFAVNFRLPDILQQVTQEFSGYGGVFVEPKSVDGRSPSAEYQVVWLAKADIAQLTLQRQTIAEVCGLARMGSKMGLRCRVQDAAKVFALLKPGQTYLPQGKKQTYVCGPFPFGTLRSSVSAALAEGGWTARVFQPVAAKSHVNGLMYKVHAVNDPPAKIMHMAHGDVVISKEEDEEIPALERPKMVATPATESFVAKDGEIDLVQLHDPWAKAAQKLSKAHPATATIGNPIEDMEQKVVAAVLAQLPKQPMEVDTEQAGQRVAQLEQQVAELQSHTQALGKTVQNTALEQAAQIQEVRTQVQQQGAHLEAAVAAQAAQIQGFQDQFQEQFKQQVTHQQTMLDSMFSKQMSQFEGLLMKRQRQE